MKPSKNDSVSHGSQGTNEGTTQAGIYGVPGAAAGGMQHRMYNRKNNNNQGPPAQTAPLSGSEGSNYGIPLSREESRKTGKRG